MNENFSDSELLLRAVFPPASRPRFWKNGRLSSAALKDKYGLSVSRTGDRSLKDSVDDMVMNFKGLIVSIAVPDCRAINANIKYCPSERNTYHSEIHGSDTEVMLSDEQAFFLAKVAKIEYEP